MFDIHTHIIYAIDDGARSLDESIGLIEMDAAYGVTDIIATPHYYPEHPTDPVQILHRLDNIRQAMESHEIGKKVRLYPGNEIFWFDGATEALAEHRILTLAGSRYVLVEFLPDENFDTIYTAVRKLVYAGYIPVLAHAERYKSLRASGMTDAVIKQGACIQVNTGSFNGGILDPAARFVKQAVRNDQVRFIGSDMHRTDRRPPVWSAALKYIENTSHDPDALLSGNARKLFV